MLSQDRAEGEGGEEQAVTVGGVLDPRTLPLDEGREASGEEEEDDWEMVGLETEEEEEEDEKKEEEEEEEGSDKAEGDEGRRKSRHGALTRHARRGKLNLLKSLHLNRLKKSVSAGEGGDSEEGQEEKKHLWRITKLPGRSRKLSKERSERVALESEAGSQEEDRTPETEEEVEVEDEGSGRRQPGETGSKGSLKLAKVFQPHLLAVSRRGRSKVDREVAAEEEVVAMEEGEGHTAIPAHQGIWRSRKTRRARRLTRGHKVQDEEGGEREMEKQGESEVSLTVG